MRVLVCKRDVAAGGMPDCVEEVYGPDRMTDFLQVTSSPLSGATAVLSGIRRRVNAADGRNRT
jgi:hypothetical protein